MRRPSRSNDFRWDTGFLYLDSTVFKHGRVLVIAFSIPHFASKILSNRFSLWYLGNPFRKKNPNTFPERVRIWAVVSNILWSKFMFTSPCEWFVLTNDQVPNCHLVFLTLASDSSGLSRAKNGVADRSKILFDILLNQSYCYLAVQVKRKP